jgi:hypothetical protein
MDPIRRFEVIVLRPLWLILGAGLLFAVVTARWPWVGASLLGLGYLGTVGSKLHPLQSAGALAKGPHSGLNAVAESALLPDDIKAILVGHACTRVGLLAGAVIATVLIGAVGVAWYWSLVLALLTTVLLGGILKSGFGVP